MRQLQKFTMLALVCILAAGCASTNSRVNIPCLLIGAGAGAATGILIEGDEAATGIGVLAGTAIAAFLCQDGDADGDGVSDKNDQCPGTPSGVQVDARGCPPDSDGDGVPDHQDRCPGTPAGTPVDRNGCPKDSDGDGVADGADRCPGTPRGVKVDSRGCPPDSDGDGVPDYLDKCPGTPRGVAVNSNGCPKVGETLISLENVNFAHDKASLTRAAETTLQLAVEVLKSNGRVRVQVEGHTDSSGTESYNQDLSERRAAAVVNYLSSRGIDRSRMVPAGFGESRPITGNDTSAGRARNRRVDFVVIK